ncbi:uncharacterized protein LOC108905583 [Anoplophora glabripennis]|nr:uncharacterized protein LOC108905583 [Anoplophora glabripennis]XP_018564039.1 uncharacterized protein LOC108905583 [Anoplophora glabripennis]XP_018564040.1 uncharacterized protein LOC108905583 [Anoplophora glabripennis]
MNFSTSEFVLGRQRGRQWVPLISQQFRLRHVYQIIGFNLLSETAGSYYFTLHLTTMCAPFYTSQQIQNPNPKWPELDLRNIANTSASCVVLRIWQHCSDGADNIILTWGVHFSGLVYIGNKIAEIQPVYFKNNSVILYMQGGYYTSHHVIKTDLQKPIPFLNNVNLINTLNNKVIYRRIAIKSPQCEIQDSYSLNKLRRLHSLQVEIKKKSIEVQNVRDKINVQTCTDFSANESLHESIPSSSSCSIRYAPQLLTMNSLNRMLQEKPTKVQKQEMTRINKEIELEKFRIRLLSQEKDKKNVIIRQLKQKHSGIIEENEERNFNLMENYHMLSREGERLKEYKKSLLQHREVYSLIYFQLQQRRRRLLQELLFIYPIDKHSEEKYTVHGIYLPRSDILADCSDTGLSVALGYITHMLIMCSTFLQVPLRYPVTHCGSRSYITDNVSPLLPEKERDFPLYTRGKDKAQFTYAVYLLNKNLAQLRWLFYMNTSDLKSTLPNLLNFLQGQKEFRFESLSPTNISLSSKHDQPGDAKQSPPHLAVSEKYVSLHSFGSNPNISDPILDCIRHENQIQRSSSPTRKPSRKPVSKPCRNSECGRGLSEILAIPEAFLNKQISSDSFRNYIVSEKYSSDVSKDGSCCGGSITTHNSIGAIKITNGKEIDSYNENVGEGNELTHQESIEQGTDPLDPTTNLSAVITKSINIQTNSHTDKNIISDFKVTQSKRMSRSAGSYTDDESSLVLRTTFEIGSEPQLNISNDLNLNSGENESIMLPECLQEGQQEFLEKWLKTTPNFISSDENLYPDEYLGTSSGTASQNSPLMARTDALLSTKSFNLVKPKP